MSVTLLGSPENRRVLRATAIADGIVAAADVDANWEVSIGSSIYQQMVPLATFAIGSPAWIVEMQALEVLYPGGAISASTPAPATAVDVLRHDDVDQGDAANEDDAQATSQPHAESSDWD